MEEMIYLTPWTGVFLGNEYPEDELRHTYWSARNKQMYGITSVVNWALPSTYDGVSEEVMNKAAMFGTEIHNQVEEYELWGGDANTDALKFYADIKKKNKFRVIATEFVVSDNKRFASPIDMVAVNEDDEIILVDIKCTGERLEEKVSLQLSFYADWFEKQTGLKVKGVYHLWFKKDTDKETKARYVSGVEFNEVRRVDSKTLSKLLREYNKCTVYTKIGKLFIPKSFASTKYTYNPYPKELATLAKQLDRLNQQYIKAEAELKMKRDQFQQAMDNIHIRGYKVGNATISMSAGRTTERFDSAKWKSEHPDEVAQYIKVSVSKPSISIRYSKK